MCHANTIHKKAGIALLIAYIVDFRAGILRDKDRIKGKIHQENIKSSNQMK